MKFDEQIGFKTSAGIRASLSNTEYYPFHLHENYIEIICLLSGNISIYDSAVQYSLAKNEVHIFNSTDPHKIESAADDTCILTVHIDKSKYIGDYQKQNKDLKLAYFVAHSNQKSNALTPEMMMLRFLLAKTYVEYSRDMPSDHTLNDLAHQIIDLCFEQFHDYAYEILTSGNYHIVRRKYDGRDFNEFYRVYRIADYIEANFNKKIKLTDIAEVEYLSVPYLSKYIKENIGITFSQLVSIARCSEAERLLANTNRSIEQIAYTVGFANRAHLFTHFSRWFSKSPSKYRSMINDDSGDEIRIRYGVLPMEKVRAILFQYLDSSYSGEVGQPAVEEQGEAKAVVSIGNHDFQSLRESNSFYVDKTALIREWWEGRDLVTLITRPHCFGKTLNMSMLEQFFSNAYAGRGDLFEGLAIWKEEAYRSLQGSYPLIFLSFANIRGSSFEEARESMIQMLIDLYAKYRFLLRNDVLNRVEREYFDYIKPDMPDAAAAISLHRLMRCMNRCYGKKVIILLDDYDTPLQEAYLYGYWHKMASFIRRLFYSTFKTNPYLERAIITGVLHVSQGSVFAELNNLEVITAASDKYASVFGFTEDEVQNALRQFHLADAMDRVKFCYNGFRFGDKRNIYNPWSITKYLDSGKLEARRLNAGSDSLAEKLIREGTPDIKMALEDLLNGKSIETPLDEEIMFDQLGGGGYAIWGLLLAFGYLKIETVLRPPLGFDDDNLRQQTYRLSLTNREAEQAFRAMFRGWFSHPRARYKDFIRALLANNVTYMNQYMNCITAETFHLFAAEKEPCLQEPERFFHSFVLALLVDTQLNCRITSSRESGFGRYDVIAEPQDRAKDSYIFEFKVREPDSERTLEDTLSSALCQIENHRLDTDLLARGIPKERIHRYGFAFEGQEVLIGGK